MAKQCFCLEMVMVIMDSSLEGFVRGMGDGDAGMDGRLKENSEWTVPSRSVVI